MSWWYAIVSRCSIPFALGQPALPRTSRHFVFPTTEAKVWVDDQRGVITRVAVLAPPSRCVFCDQGLRETLRAAGSKDHL